MRRGRNEETASRVDNRFANEARARVQRFDIKMQTSGVSKYFEILCAVHGDNGSARGFGSSASCLITPALGFDHEQVRACPCVCVCVYIYSKWRRRFVHGGFRGAVGFANLFD